MIEKFEFDVSDEGVSLLILAAIHGNETAGTHACHKILQEISDGKLNLKKGKVTIVPICNPEAYRKDVRCIEENLNRVMTMHETPKTYEQKLANEICPLIKSHRVMLDLHSTHCKGDVPFAFCDYLDEYNSKILDGLNVGYVLEGWPDIYDNQDEIGSFSTEGTAHAYGNIGTTLECGYHKDKHAVDLAYQAIISTLAAFEMIDADALPTYPKKHIQMKKFVLKTKEGKLCKEYKHLDEITKGEIIAKYDDGETLVAEENCYILLPNLNAQIGAEWYYIGTAK